MKHTNALQNEMKRQADRALGVEAKPRTGIVDGYDPSHYAVKVRIQPENTLTGWMPLGSPWIGNQWGMYAPPSLGDPIEIHYEQNNPNAPYAVLKFFNNSIQPLEVPSGEFWLVHKSGQYFKLLNDGTIDSMGTWNHIGPLNVTGDVTVTGNVFVTEDITDQTLTTNETIRSMRHIYDIHVHLPGDVTPTPQM